MRVPKKQGSTLCVCQKNRELHCACAKNRELPCACAKNRELPCACAKKQGTTLCMCLCQKKKQGTTLCVCLCQKIGNYIEHLVFVLFSLLLYLNFFISFFPRAFHSSRVEIKLGNWCGYGPSFGWQLLCGC